MGSPKSNHKYLLTHTYNETYLQMTLILKKWLTRHTSVSWIFILFNNCLYTFLHIPQHQFENKEVTIACSKC